MDVVFLETLLIATPLLALHSAMLFGTLPVTPLCRVLGPEASPVLGSLAAEQACLRQAAGPAASAFHITNALLAAAFVAAVLLDGWASPVRARLLL